MPIVVEDFSVNSVEQGGRRKFVTTFGVEVKLYLFSYSGIE
ncbi:hypothetical protein HY29_15650 [Hyphomonas beringensis]|uniref:Uncharacterized protein n=1 Tax=Hyphomonas beringensis TaxID=1280946 RepID=A0A062U1K9_9PROT|nr:hypothetical protein HY29_15650 [Hyphomonas beringensis]